MTVPSTVYAMLCYAMLCEAVLYDPELEHPMFRSADTLARTASRVPRLDRQSHDHLPRIRSVLMLHCTHAYLFWERLGVASYLAATRLASQ